MMKKAVSIVLVINMLITTFSPVYANIIHISADMDDMTNAEYSNSLFEYECWETMQKKIEEEYADRFIVKIKTDSIEDILFDLNSSEMLNNEGDIKIHDKVQKAFEFSREKKNEELKNLKDGMLNISECLQTDEKVFFRNDS